MERIVSKISEEKVGNSTVVTTESVCPNVICQKQVNRENKRILDKFMSNKLRSEERAKQRRLTRVVKAPRLAP